MPDKKYKTSLCDGKVLIERVDGNPCTFYEESFFADAWSIALGAELLTTELLVIEAYEPDENDDMRMLFSANSYREAVDAWGALNEKIDKYGKELFRENRPEFNDQYEEEDRMESVGKLRMESNDNHHPGWREAKHPNGMPMYSTEDGTLLDDKGDRSIFDDIDD